MKKFVASRSIALVLQGIPGIYLHSLIGTENDIEAVVVSKSKRDINRTVIDEQAISFALGDGLSKISRINREFGRLIDIRTKHRAFHPNSPQKIIRKSTNIFTVYRQAYDNSERVLTLVNVSDQVSHIEIDLKETGCMEDEWTDVVNGMEYMSEDTKLFLTLQPYDVVWLMPTSEAGTVE